MSGETQTARVTDSCLLAVSSHGRRGEGSLWGLFLGALILFLNVNPLQYFCLENSMDRGAWWATVHGVPKS